MDFILNKYSTLQGLRMYNIISKSSLVLHEVLRTIGVRGTLSEDFVFLLKMKVKGSNVHTSSEKRDQIINKCKWDLLLCESLHLPPSKIPFLIFSPPEGREA